MEDAVVLERKLLSLSEQLAAEKHVNKQLLLDIEFYQNREKSSAANFKDIKNKVQVLLKEKDELQADNDMLKLELIESKKKLLKKRTLDDEEANTASHLLNRAASQISRASDENRSGQSSSSSSRRNSNTSRQISMFQEESDKTRYLEQQVISLTREKKQLMTHLHWLSRQRTDTSQPEKFSERIDDKLSRMSLEEGSCVGYNTQLSNMSQSSSTGPCLVRSKRFECLSRNDSEECGACADKDSDCEGPQQQPAGNASKDLHLGTSTRQIIDRLKSLKEILQIVKLSAGKNNQLSDAIFELSFQNLKHPNEPSSYSNWSSYDEEKISAWTSLMKSHQVPNLMQDSRFGYRSLEINPQASKREFENPAMYQDFLARKKSSISSPELYPYKRKVLDDYMFQISRMHLDHAEKESMLLTRSLSDQQSKSLGMFDCPPHSLSSRTRENRVFSTISSTEDEQVKSLQFCSSGFLLSQPQDSLLDAEQKDPSVSTTSTLTNEIGPSENLIS